MGDLSEHFSRSEFRCRHCQQLVGPDPELIRVLEEIRRRSGGRPLRIVSGYRCRIHNRNVGGARNSQHVHGRAADLNRGRVSIDTARAAGARGIGYASDGTVVHVDVRPGPVRVFSDP